MNKYHSQRLLPHRFASPPANLPNHANVGLWYEKYCYTWDIEKVVTPKGKIDWKNTGSSPKYKTAWIDTVTRRKIGKKKELQEACDRLSALSEHMGGKSIPMESTSRFVTGIGQAHYVENGFSFHHTLGVPYIPGSSLKGMVRAWANEWAEWKNEEEQKQVMNRIFGPDNRKDGRKRDKKFDSDSRNGSNTDRNSDSDNRKNNTTDRSIGKILFMDAIPMKPVKLEKDILTAHHMDYYGDLVKVMDGKKSVGKGRNPTDADLVKPIPFLAMAKGHTFLFSFFPIEKYEEYKEDVKRVEGWLIYALQWMGAGAKTANGYGRFMLVPET
ncbi:MAG: type III-B CRISPR module RAMP protein Cmr6 [Thermoactinomyces sp.]